MEDIHDVIFNNVPATLIEFNGDGIRAGNLVFFHLKEGLVGVPTRGPGSQLVNVVCFLVPDDDARGNHSNAWFILVPSAGPYVQQRGCARALYYLAPGVLVVGGTSEAREGEKLPSLS